MTFHRTFFNYTAASTSGGEIDLSTAFDEFIYGGSGRMPHGSKIVVRNLRRDSNLKPTVCTCKDPLTKEGDPDCSFCQGEGYLWDEVWADCYSVYEGSDGGLINKNITLPPGQLRVDYRTFYFRYSTIVIYGDKIVEMKLDEEGRVVVPYIRKAIYTPETIQEYRSDHGRIEYIAVRCRERDAIRTDYV